MSLPHGEDLSVTAKDEAFRTDEDFGTSRIKQCALNPDLKVPQYSVDPSNSLHLEFYLYLAMNWVGVRLEEF